MELDVSVAFESCPAPTSNSLFETCRPHPKSLPQRGAADLIHALLKVGPFYGMAAKSPGKGCPSESCIFQSVHFHVFAYPFIYWPL